LLPDTIDSHLVQACSLLLPLEGYSHIFQLDTLFLSTFLASEEVATLVVGFLLFFARVADLGIVELDYDPT